MTRMTKLQRLGTLAGMVRGEAWLRSTSIAEREAVAEVTTATRGYLAELGLDLTADVVLALAGGARMQAQLADAAVRRGPLGALAALMPEAQMAPIMVAVVGTLAAEVLEGGELS